MKTIWKFILKPNGMFSENCIIEMPQDSEALSVAAQHGEICLWAMVNTEAPKVQRVFRVYGTGHPIRHPVPGAFVGTVLLEGGALVLHVFDSAKDD